MGLLKLVLFFIFSVSSSASDAVASTRLSRSVAWPSASALSSFSYFLADVPPFSLFDHHSLFLLNSKINFTHMYTKT
jgi:hypothetical protein